MRIAHEVSRGGTGGGDAKRRHFIAKYPDFYLAYPRLLERFCEWGPDPEHMSSLTFMLQQLDTLKKAQRDVTEEQVDVASKVVYDMLNAKYVNPVLEGGAAAPAGAAP
jgi:hypothetical protein